jgi:hypothetical protein
MAAKRKSNKEKDASNALPPKYAQHLIMVRRAAKKNSEARAYLDEAIRQARAHGAPLRAIADECGFSPEWVRRITED